MKQADVIKSQLLTAIDELISDPLKFTVNPDKDFTRNRKLGAKDLIQLLLTMEADCINEEIYKYFGYSTNAPTKAAFYKQRCKLNSKALPNLLQQFNSKLSEKLYGNGYRLIACDGSTVNIFRNPDDKDSYYPPDGRSKYGVNLIHINAFYNILDRRITNMVIQPGRKRNEYYAFCEMVDVLGNDGIPTIFFADRGYASYNNIAHVVENGNYFLIRCNDKRLERILGCPIENLRETDCHVDRILTRSQSVKKRSRPELAEQYRYICQNISMDYIDDTNPEYDINFRIVRFELSPGNYENILTNLPDIEFDFEDFKYLYFLRWNEENCFRDLKYPLALNYFHSKKYQYIVQEIWARAILHNFSTAIVAAVSIKKERTMLLYQVNFAEAFKICRQFLRIHNHDPLMEVESLIAKHVEAIRPGRTFERNLRSFIPFSFCYRN